MRTLRQLLLLCAVLMVLVGIAVSGCAKPAAPRLTAAIPSVPVSQAASINPEGYLRVAAQPRAGQVSVHPGESFVAQLIRSVDGTLGGTVYVYRDLPATGPVEPFGMAVFAVEPSRVVTIAAVSWKKPAVRTARIRIRQVGGSWVLYYRIPPAARALRISSSLRPWNPRDSSTLWLEVPLSSIPVGTVSRTPPGSMPF